MQLMEYLHDLQSSANSTHRISSRLRDFVIGREFKPVNSDLGMLITKVITDLERNKPGHIQIGYFQPSSLPKIKRVIPCGWNNFFQTFYTMRLRQYLLLIRDRSR